MANRGSRAVGLFLLAFGAAAAVAAVLKGAGWSDQSWAGALVFAAIIGIVIAGMVMFRSRRAA
jgi:Na+-driven multidrug efflux pump